MNHTNLPPEIPALIPLDVLLLEDDPADAQRVLDELRVAGFTPTAQRVDSEQAFRQRLQAGQRLPDLILAEYALPRFDGLRALQIVQEATLDIPFIFFTGTIDDEVAIGAIKQGAADYLSKDRLARLGLAVVQALEQKRLRTERRVAEQLLRDSELRYRALIENSADAITLVTADGTVLYSSPATDRILGREPNRWLRGNWLNRIHPHDLPLVSQMFAQLARTPGARASATFRDRHIDGSWRWLEGTGTNLLGEPSVRAIVFNYRDITERKQAVEALAASEAELRALFAAMTDIVLVMDSEGRYLQIAPTNPTRLYKPPGELVGRTIHDVLPPADADHILHTIRQALQEQRPVAVEYSLTMGHALTWFDGTVSPMGADKVFLIARDVTEPKQAAEALRASEERFRHFFELGLIGMAITSLTMGISEVNAKLCDTLGYERSELLQKTLGELTHPDDLAADVDKYVDVLAGTIDGYSMDKRFIRKDGQVIDTTISVRCVRKTDGSVDHFLALLQDISERKQARDALLQSEQRYRQIFETSQEGVWVIDKSDRTTLVNKRLADLFGYTENEMMSRNLFDFLDSEAKGGAAASLERRRQGIDEEFDFRFKRKDGTDLWALLETSSLIDVKNNYVGTLAMLTDITERKRVEVQARQHLARLSSLRHIDMAISTSFDLVMTLDTLMQEVTSQLGTDAAGILLLDPSSLTLEFAAGRGFRTPNLERGRIRLGEGLAGRAVLERRLVAVPNLPASGREFVRASLFAGESFMAYYGMPLLARGQVKGILEVFHRARLDPDQEWLDFFAALAGHAAIAIDDAQLFSGLQRSNLELILAYDTTIEGWSRALDLRDNETEGHTQRVTELTLSLARTLQIQGPELVHIHRGALLHDIGKMGVPDNILLKPGPLSDAEWIVMQRHPICAYQLLSPIAFLHPALDIPYCHHEKWDGTGYPRGLKGEEIPLSARIFAVVDVWDSLLSDRPYRPAWPADKVREHIREQSGKHFDPKVVDAFLTLTATNLSDTNDA
jgi:PAS domain S-box-containing protein